MIGANVPILANRLFERYDYDPLLLTIGDCPSITKFVPEPYSSMSSDELGNPRGTIPLEALVKFCHLTENLLYLVHF
jgi:hypothetical protein